MSEEKKNPYPALFKQLEQYFSPARHWEACLNPLTQMQFFEEIDELVPGFYDRIMLVKLLKEAGFKYSHNEHNNKYYWLVNPV